MAQERKNFDHAMDAYKLDMIYSQEKRWKQKPGERFEKGDRVKIFMAGVPARNGLATKLLSRWATNYEVVGCAGGAASETWLVQRRNDKTAPVPVHVSRIKRYSDPLDRRGLTPITTLTTMEDEEDDSGEYARAIIYNDPGSVTGNGALQHDIATAAAEMTRPLAPDQYKERIERHGWDVPLQWHERATCVDQAERTTARRDKRTRPEEMQERGKADQSTVEPFHERDPIREREGEEENTKATKKARTPKRDGNNIIIIY